MSSKKLGVCHNCNKNEGKYRCPRCNAVSCSLKCCNQHKIRKDCNGTRDKIEFVALNKMNDISLQKDMKFLMDLSSKIDLSKREPLLHQHQDRDTNDRFRSLCSAAKSKKIRLFLQPIGMAKHQNNQTFITKSQPQKDIIKTIHWTMSIQFGKDQLLLHDIEENQTLISVLRNLKKQKFEKLESNTIINKFIKNDNDKMEIGHKDNILDKYNKYFNDMNYIRLPKRKKSRKNRNNSFEIARSVINDILYPNLWKSLSMDNVQIDDKDKLNIILKIPNHFMYLRINPNLSILSILKQKIINEYPEFIVLLPSEMKKGDYVIMDNMEQHQFGNTIKHNTKIQTQRQRLKVEMERKLNDKKLFNRHRNNNRRYYNKHNNNNRNNHNKFGSSSNYRQFNKFHNKHQQIDNGLQARDLFNGNIINNGNKRNFNTMNGNNNYNNYNGYKEPSNKKQRYHQTNNLQQKTHKQNNQNNWYLYL